MASPRVLLALVAAAALAACDGRTPEEREDTGGPPSSGCVQPGFRVTLAFPSRGTQALLPVMLARWGGFTGTVAVSGRVLRRASPSFRQSPQGTDSSGCASARAWRRIRGR